MKKMLQEVCDVSRIWGKT